MALVFYPDITMIDQILPYFSFNLNEIIILSLLFLFFLIEVFFYMYYYRKPYTYIKRKEKDNYVPVSSKPKVSVIIVSENEAGELARNLPNILDQDYPDFEVIVVNNGSTDESDELLQSLKLSNPHLYHTYLPYSSDKVFGRHKIALTIGIKAAKGDVLLFTEPYSKPISNKWISSMMEELTETKDVVLGYSFFEKSKHFFNLIARFDNHLHSMQYLGMAILKRPYTGVYRNIAYRKHLFFDNKGFASHLNIENGEDVFISHIMNSENTTIAVSQDSFIETSCERFSLWKQIKRAYSSTRSYMKSSAPKLFSFEAFSRYIFYFIFLYLLVYSIIIQHWVLLGTSVLLLILKLVFQWISLDKPGKYFHSGKIFPYIILLELLQPIYNLRFRNRSKKRM